MNSRYYMCYETRLTRYIITARIWQQLQVIVQRKPSHASTMMETRTSRIDRRMLNLLTNPHSDILVQIDSIAHNISL